MLYNLKYGIYDDDTLRSSWFKNLTDLQIPKLVVEIVSLGNKFNLPDREISTIEKINFIKNIEINLYQFPKNLHNDIRQNTVDIIKKQEQKAKKKRH